MNMGSMNSNNWLSFPLSPTHPSLPLNLHASQSQQFSLGLVNDSMETPFQTQEWNLINTHGSSEVPKIADFLGVSKSENQADLEAFNEIQGNDSDYFFPNNGLLPVAAAAAAVAQAAASPNSTYEFQENNNNHNNNNLQALTLSMGSGGAGKASSTCETSGNSSNNSIVEAAAPRRTLDTFGQRTSIYRGVTRHRWTGRYEAHLWDNSCRREGQSRKGRQVYLGGYDKEEKAARAYDLAALKYWGTSTTTNFPISNYERELEEMKHMTRQEFVASIRRKSSGFSRGASMYRGVTRHHQHGRWQARIGRVAGNKDLYLGTFSTEEEAAEAYDIAAIKFRGLNAVTNFDMNRYDVKSILESNTLPIGGGAAKRLKEAQAMESSRKREEMIALGSSFQYGSSSSSRLPNFPLMQQQFEQPQPLLTLQNQEPLLTLQNPEISHHYPSQDDSSSQFHQNYIQTQLQLHQQPAGSSFLNHSGQTPPPPVPPAPQFYNSYLHNNPALLHGLMNMENTAGSSTTSGGYNNGGYFSNGLGLGSNSTVNTTVGSGGELPLIKVDYDMPAGYGVWSGESVQGQSGGVFTMWND